MYVCSKVACDNFNVINEHDGDDDDDDDDLPVRLQLGSHLTSGRCDDD